MGGGWGGVFDFHVHFRTWVFELKYIVIYKSDTTKSDIKEIS